MQSWTRLYVLIWMTVGFRRKGVFLQVSCGRKISWGIAWKPWAGWEIHPDGIFHHTAWKDVGFYPWNPEGKVAQGKMQIMVNGMNLSGTTAGILVTGLWLGCLKKIEDGRICLYKKSPGWRLFCEEQQINIMETIIKYFTYNGMVFSYKNTETWGDAEWYWGGWCNWYRGTNALGKNISEFWENAKSGKV